MRDRSPGVTERMITTKEIDPAEILRSVRNTKAGAVVLFLGTVRDTGDHGLVKGMTYEAYSPLAEAELVQLKREIRKRWPKSDVRIVHRVGRLQLKDVSVAIAVSSVHRAEAFEACRFAIERIKKGIPIWKKEELSNGTEVWVEGSKMGS
jgi:molybdopterin synthase catalytic subunit